jgi:hypothetical protein
MHNNKTIFQLFPINTFPYNIREMRCEKNVECKEKAFFFEECFPSLSADALEIKQKQSLLAAQTGMHTRIFCVAIMRKKEKCALRDEKEIKKERKNFTQNVHR